MASTMNLMSLDALKLPAHQRLGLATLLLESLDDPSGGVDLELLHELSGRAAELRDGNVKGLSTEEAYGFSL